MAFTIKQHDNYPSLELTLTDNVGPIDVTNATVLKLILKEGTRTILGTCDTVDAVNGVIVYNWELGDTDVAGVFKGEVEITWPQGKTETVPNDGYFEVTIMSDLG